MKLNVHGSLKCWLWRLASLLRAEHKFNCDITGLRKAEMWMTLLALVAGACQQSMKTLKLCRKWFWIIDNSCHKVVRLIRNTILKLCADCVRKEFVRNAQNCGKANHEFCTMIIHQLSLDSYAWVFSQKQNRNHAFVFTVFILQTEDIDDRRYDWGDKRKIVRIE